MIASGGYDESSGKLLNALATPKLNQDGWIKFDTSFELAGHCMSQLDSIYLVLTGGYHISASGLYSQSTYFYSWYNSNGNLMTTGPDLMMGRAQHGCAFITGKDGVPTAIVAGGLVETNARTTSVEIFNRGLNKWESGPALPQPMSGFKVPIFKTLNLSITFIKANVILLKK